MIRRSVIVVLSIIFLIGCSYRQNDVRLIRIAEIISDSPQSALAALDSIAYDKLSENDRQFYDFLLIKARDKAFVRHTSDSLILKVIATESSRSNRARYNESLYYGGRVYHDLGDFPSALNYYQKALADLTDDHDDMVLKGCIMSQMANVLSSLRLFSQAIPYVKDAISLDSILRDSVNYVEDCALMGFNLLNIKEYDSAEFCFNKARDIANKINLEDTAVQDVYLSALKYQKGELDSALNLIRPAMSKIDSLSRNMALAFASEIYLKKGISDTARLYAHELISREDLNNKKTGYQILLSDELKDLIPADSLLLYVRTYRDLMEEYLNQNSNKAALIQNSFYNYHRHQQEKLSAEAHNRKLLFCLGISIIVLLSLLIYTLFIKNKNKTQLLKLHEALDEIESLRNSLRKASEQSPGIISEKDNEIIKDYETTKERGEVEELRERLKAELIGLSNEVPKSYSPPSEILRSIPYQEIQNHLKTGSSIPDTDPLWERLEKIVTKVSPKFKKRLQLLTGRKLKPTDLHLALLIKCGFTPVKIAVLSGRTRSTITYRKDTLGQKIFNEKIEGSHVEVIIRML